MNRPLSERFPPERVLALVTVILTIALAVYLVTFTQAQRVAAECQEQINGEFRAALTTRTAVAGDERVALRQVLVDALADPPLPDRTRDSLARYLQILDRADADRARAPLPTADAGCS